MNLPININKFEEIKKLNIKSITPEMCNLSCINTEYIEVIIKIILDLYSRIDLFIKREEYIEWETINTRDRNSNYYLESTDIIKYIRSIFDNKITDDKKLECCILQIINSYLRDKFKIYNYDNIFLFRMIDNNCSYKNYFMSKNGRGIILRTDKDTDIHTNKFIKFLKKYDLIDNDISKKDLKQSYCNFMLGIKDNILYEKDNNLINLDMIYYSDINILNEENKYGHHCFCEDCNNNQKSESYDQDSYIENDIIDDIWGFVYKCLQEGIEATIKISPTREVSIKLKKANDN